jgi:hypothetical protein
VNPLIPRLGLIATALIFVIASYCGYIAATESESPRKAKCRLVASLLFSSWFFLSAGLWMLYDNTRPIFEFNGTIESVQIFNSSSKHYSANLKIQTADGGEVSIHVSDRSPYLQPNQRLWIQYRGDTGELIKASFMTESGQPRGVLRSTSTFSQIIGIVVGLFCIWASIRKYRRDPKGSET